jgi:hypothetical protein
MVRSIDSCILGLDRCIDICAQMCRHCNGQNVCHLCLFIFCMQQIILTFNHEASQRNYCACLSAAGNEAEFVYSAFAATKMPQFNRPQLVPNTTSMTL